MAEHSVSVSPRPASRPGLSSGRLIVVVTLGVAVIVVGFLVLGMLVGEGFGYFSKEPAETFRVPRYIGWQAYAVVLITTAGAVSALFGGFIVRRQQGPGVAPGFLLGAGWFTVMLVIDDFFQFHDYVYVRLFRLDERLVYLAYALIALGVAWRWGRHVARVDASMVVLAGAWLALSISADQLFDKAWPSFHLLEDGAKMMGLSLWAVFLTRTAARLVLGEPAREAQAAPQLRPESTRWQPRIEDVQETVMCHAVTPSGAVPVHAPIPLIPEPRSAPTPPPRAKRSPGQPLSPALRRRGGVVARSRG